MTGPVFPEDSWVQVCYPLTSEHEHAGRAGWPWLPGWVVSVCGPDEWEACVQAPELATWREGEACCPTCSRDSSEIRLPEAQADLDRAARPGLEAQLAPCGAALACPGAPATAASSSPPVCAAGLGPGAPPARC